MPRKTNSDTPQLQYPEFASREEESAWYDANAERLMADLLRYGKMVPAKLVEKTQQLTLRIPVSDVETAREIAASEGLHYQTVLKRAIRNGLKKGG